VTLPTAVSAPGEVVAPLGLTLEAVTKRYVTPAGTVHAVEGVDLTLEPGTSLAIVGPSGCGKSTLLGLIGGLDTPTSGRVVVGSHELSSMSEVERARVRRTELGFVFQSDNLLPFLTATENVSLQLAIHGAGDAWDRSRALLEALGLDDRADHLPDQLSGGQRQRVAIARALVHRPRLVLADEPTGSLDDATSLVLLDVLLEAHRAAGASLVVVTHDPSVAARMDRTIGLRDGRVVADTAAGGPAQG
jgi:putative ABC transport system ATP-binding protein